KKRNFEGHSNLSKIVASNHGDFLASWGIWLKRLFFEKMPKWSVPRIILHHFKNRTAVSIKPLLLLEKAFLPIKLAIDKSSKPNRIVGMLV
ncbi:MAG: hypothetical protein ABSA10_02820, partial [Anaerolineales bacterium]